MYGLNLESMTSWDSDQSRPAVYDTPIARELPQLDIPEEADFDVVTVLAYDVLFHGDYDIGGTDEWVDGFTVDSSITAIMRKDTNHIFKFASNRYKALHNRDIVACMKEAILDSGINVDGMEVKHTFSPNHAKWSSRVIFPQVTIEPAINDIVRYGLKISNSYDLTWAFSQSSQADRLWCLNGCTTAETSYATHRKHTTKISVEGEAAKLRLGIESFFESEGTYARWMNTPVSSTDAEHLFENTLACTFIGGRPKVAVKTLDELMIDWQRTQGETLWTAYNVATAWATHVVPERGGWAPNAQRGRDSKVVAMLGHNAWKELENV